MNQMIAKLFLTRDCPECSIVKGRIDTSNLSKVGKQGQVLYLYMAGSSSLIPNTPKPPTSLSAAFDVRSIFASRATAACTCCSAMPGSWMTSSSRGPVRLCESFSPADRR